MKREVMKRSHQSCQLWCASSKKKMAGFIHSTHEHTNTRNTCKENTKT